MCSWRLSIAAAAAVVVVAAACDRRVAKGDRVVADVSDCDDCESDGCCCALSDS